MRILMIEDDIALQAILSKRLMDAGFIVDSCFNGEEGFSHAKHIEYDCIILDIMIPKLSGLTLLKKLRSQGDRSNIIIVTAKDSIEDRILGLDAGADDYLIKPFDFDELLARIRAVLRRQSITKNNLLTLADLTIDVANYLVVRGGSVIKLTSKEYALLEYLMRNQGHILTRSQIAAHVWHSEFDYDSNVVDVYIRYLRHKVDKHFEPKLIQTVRGFGYVMRVE